MRAWAWVCCLADCLLIVPAVVLFLLALALYLAQQGMSPVAAHVLAGVVGAVLGGVLIITGLARLKPSSLTPETTIRQIQKDVAAAKDMAR